MNLFPLCRWRKESSADQFSDFSSVSFQHQYTTLATVQSVSNTNTQHWPPYSQLTAPIHNTGHRTVSLQHQYTTQATVQSVSNTNTQHWPPYSQFTAPTHNTGHRTVSLQHQHTTLATVQSVYSTNTKHWPPFSQFPNTNTQHWPLYSQFLTPIHNTGHRTVSFQHQYTTLATVQSVSSTNTHWPP